MYWISAERKQSNLLISLKKKLYFKRSILYLIVKPFILAYGVSTCLKNK